MTKCLENLNSLDKVINDLEEIMKKLDKKVSFKIPAAGYRIVNNLQKDLEYIRTSHDTSSDNAEEFYSKVETAQSMINNIYVILNTYK